MLKPDRTQALLYLLRSCDLPPSPGHPCEAVLCSFIIKHLDLLCFCSDLPSSMGFPRRRQWHPTPVLLPGKPHGRRSLVGCNGVTKSRTLLSDLTFTFHFHVLEKEMATHSSVLAWRIPGMGEPGGLLSMGSHRVRHDRSDLAAAAAAWASQVAQW